MVFIGFRLCSIGHFTAIATCKNKGHPAARCFPMGRWFFTNTEQLNPGGMDSGQSCSNSPWSPRKPWRKLKGYGLADSWYQNISNIHKISINLLPHETIRNLVLQEKRMFRSMLTYFPVGFDILKSVDLWVDLPTRLPLEVLQWILHIDGY